MIPYTPHPVLFSIGTIDIRFYSLAYLIGFILAYFAMRKRFGKNIAEDALVWIVLAVIIGGRLGYFIFYSPQTFWQDPFEIFKIWRGGMAFHGAFIAVVIAIVLFIRRSKNISFAQLADTLVIPAAIALGLGRIANFLNGELVGTVTNVIWCVQFPGFEGCRHPSQLYEAAYSFAIAGILWWQSKRREKIKYKDGFLATIFIGLYGLLRFSTNFLREDPRILGVSEGQLLSFVMLAIAAYLLAAKYKSDLRRCVGRVRA
jgi:phosphatidylglycerol:prolipoprotein diacylglycerol transferase